MAPRHQLLAGAGLAADEHGEVGGAHPLEQREDLAHAQALADQLVERLAQADVDVDRAVERLEAQHRLADAHRLVVVDPDLLHLQVAAEDAVGGVEVAQQKAALVGLDLEVRAADRLVVERQVADDAAPDGDALLLDGELAPLSGPSTTISGSAAGGGSGPRAPDDRGQTLHGPPHGGLRWRRRSSWLRIRRCPPPARRPRPGSPVGRAGLHAAVDLEVDRPPEAWIMLRRCESSAAPPG
jgi:hypothetical protein